LASDRPLVVAYRPLDADAMSRLSARCDVRVFDAPPGDARDDFRASLSAADALIGAGIELDDVELAQATRLRAISLVAAGYDGFDVDELARRDVTLMTTPDVLTDTTADLALALMLAVARRLVELAELVRGGGWTQRVGPAEFGRDVHHKVVGIVGMGRIGAAVARRAHAGFGMDVLYTSRSTKPEAERQWGARRCDLDELLRAADFVCLTLPLRPETQHLLGARELSLMKPTSVLVNVARGEVVDEDALVEALSSGTIAGAGLDVFKTEPLPPDAPLARLPNVVAVPHIGSATSATRKAMAACAVDNLIGFFDGVVVNDVRSGRDLAA
jgi:lactate dehydrogenase-like 2-hydroxyacid dehydrogenase